VNRRQVGEGPGAQVAFEESLAGRAGQDSEVSFFVRSQDRRILITTALCFYSPSSAGGDGRDQNYEEPANCDEAQGRVS
jgi:hypothetical protein